MKEKRIQIEGQDTPYLIRDNGTVWSEKRNRELKGTIKRNEYATVYLSHNHKEYTFVIHRLVAEAFCPNPNNYNIVHHKDGNKLNNSADNLEWVTSKDNVIASNYSRKTERASGAMLDPTKDWRILKIDDRYVINSEGEIANRITGKILLGCERNGYKRVSIERKAYSVHRLVYETFVGPIPEKMYVDHIDGNRANNNLSNLRVVTASENAYNAMRNGHSGQIPILQFDKQGNFIQEYPTIQAAANAVGRTHAALRSAINRNGTSAGYYWKKKNDMP